VTPNTQRDVRKNNAYVRLYYPLVRFEQICGSKRHLAHEPCMLAEPLPP